MEKYISDTRYKDDDSYHYVMNNSGFDLWVMSKVKQNGSSLVKGGHAIVPGGEWFITNFVFENNYRTCFLDITASKSGVSGNLKGKWSTDSVGYYPIANP